MPMASLSIMTAGQHQGPPGARGDLEAEVAEHGVVAAQLEVDEDRSGVGLGRVVLLTENAAVLPIIFKFFDSF